MPSSRQRVGCVICGRRAEGSRSSQATSRIRLAAVNRAARRCYARRPAMGWSRGWTAGRAGFHFYRRRTDGLAGFGGADTMQYRAATAALRMETLRWQRMQPPQPLCGTRSTRLCGTRNCASKVINCSKLAAKPSGGSITGLCWSASGSPSRKERPRFFRALAVYPHRRRRWWNWRGGTALGGLESVAAKNRDDAAGR